MIVGRPYQRDGDSRTYLRDLREAASVPPGYVDTGLAAMPAGTERLAWDGQRAAPPVLTAEDKLDRLSLPPRVLAALVIGALPQADTTGAERTWARQVLLDARDRLRAARDASGPSARTGP